MGVATRTTTIRRYFFDTEFHEHPHGVSLISIGIVDHLGNEFYAENAEFDPAGASEWIRANVVPKLRGPKLSLTQIKQGVREFVQVGDKWRETEFWAYYGAYDWYLLCRLFGGMLNLPDKWPWLFHDLRLALDAHGFKEVSQPEDGDTHHALADAHWIRDTWFTHIGGSY